MVLQFRKRIDVPKKSIAITKRYWLWDVEVISSQDDDDGLIYEHNEYMDDDGMTTAGTQRHLNKIKKHITRYVDVRR